MIRSYVNRMPASGKGPIVVELWRDGHWLARTFCQRVVYAEGSSVQLKSVYAQAGGGGFQGFGGAVHTWVESDADHVALLEGVTHCEGFTDGATAVMVCRSNWIDARNEDGSRVVSNDPRCPNWRTRLLPGDAPSDQQVIAEVATCPKCGEPGAPVPPVGGVEVRT